MSKVVKWGPPQLQNSNSPFLKNTKSFKEMWQKGQEVQREQEEASMYLHKAMPAMVALLEYKIKNQEPLVVMRPLRYQTSELEDQDGFYKSSGSPKFKDVIKTILPGTSLILKSLDTALNEFIFVDGHNVEHSINFAERNNLMTQTNVFEEVKNYLNLRGDNNE